MTIIFNDKIEPITGLDLLVNAANINYLIW